MVKELKVEEPKLPKYNPRAEEQITWEYVYGGVPMPDDFREVLRERSGVDWLYMNQLNQDPKAVAAAMEWDAYHLEHESNRAS